MTDKSILALNDKLDRLIEAVSLGGKHDLGSDYHFEWQAGLSKGERRTPRRVDWEFRSAAGAFPSPARSEGVRRQ